ncbi:ricin-type beta-trefoil lectin domain protein [Streptomyces sp. NBC_01390]|uniref:ricin-type beta-trefoil lectin domain protein n=1 Tax=Streptomyces sp. NBC_01390 TaxID=2903850 RepID=UPI003254E0F8
MRGGLSWCGRGRLTDRSPRDRLLRRRARLGVVAALFLALNVTSLQGAVAFGPDNDARTTVELDELQQTDAVPLDEAKTGNLEQLEAPALEKLTDYTPAAVVEVPAAVDLTAPVADVTAGGAPKQVAASADGSVTVGVTAPEGASQAQADSLEGAWNVTVKPETEAVAAGTQGLLLQVDAPDTATGNAVVQIDATRFAETYSAQWLDRLSFALMPACYATTPELEECSTGVPVTTEVQRTTDEVTVSVDEGGDSSGSETDPGEDGATDETNDSTDKTKDIQETLLNLTVDTAALASVSTATGTSTSASTGTSASTAASTDKGSVDSAVWRGDSRAGVQQAADSSAGGLLVGTSYGAGSGGDFAATPLASSGTWSQGGSSGAFTYAYTMAGPEVPSGPSPNVTLSYNSQSSDGRTSATNNQVSWIGEGWDYNPGAITRTFVGCAADTSGANNDKHFTGDQCWGSNNAVLTLNGTTTELVLDDTTGKWTTSRGDNTRVELLTSADYKDITGIDSSNNGDNNGEFWRATTSDGTQYYFGMNRLPGWTSGKEETKSVLKVPVAGNHPGDAAKNIPADPCYAPKFEDSFCDQGWRFQLDYVVDRNGNAMSLWWNRETNAYARNNKEAKAVEYDRAGYLSRIDYGQRSNTLFSAEPLGRMKFTAQQRCFEKDGDWKWNCSDANFDSKQSYLTRPWFDTPADLACKTGAKCSTYAPTFWSRKRLATVTACAQREQGVKLTEYNSTDDTGSRNACGIDDSTYGTTALSKVDSWSLDQSFPWGLTGEYTALWLESITRTGYAVDGSTERLNPVVFGRNKLVLPNRVKKASGDTDPLFGRLRIQDVVSEYGGRTHVTYLAPDGACATGANFPDVDKNTLRCYPAYWHADGELTDKRISWFHKYVVGSITEYPQLADATDVTTTYEYETDTADKTVGALWAKNQAEFSRPKTRTWDDWRGYPVITTISGVPSAPDGSVASKSVTRYFRGMSDDVLKDETPTNPKDDVKRSFKFKDVTGADIADDRKAYAGMVAESLTYPDSSAATSSGWLARTVNYPDTPVRLATRDRTDGPDVVSERVTLDTVKTITKSSGTRPGDTATLRTVKTQTDYDSYGLPTVVREYGDEAKTTDDSCTRTSYVNNDSTGTNGVYLIGLVSQTITTTGTSTCSTSLSASTASTLVSGSRVFYDGSTDLNAAPTKGQSTLTQAPTGAGTGWESTNPESRTTYDDFGRVTKVVDASGLTNLTTYTPDSGQVYEIKTIQGTKLDSAGAETGLVSTTKVEPGRGATLTSTDANNRVTSFTYDPLGRTTAAWGPTQSGADDPDAKYTYNTVEGKPVSVVTESLQDNPTSAAGDGVYTASTAIYDGLGRERQSQTPAVGGGKLITDTFHNAAGQVSFTRNAYYMAGNPDTDLIVPASESLVPNATTYTYDGLGRVLTVTPVHHSFAQTGSPAADGNTTVQTTDRRTRYEYGLDYTIVRQPKGTPGSRVWTDALGRTVQQDTYSDTALTEAGAISTTYDYDLRGDMTTSTDEVGHTRTWKYDALGRVTDTTDPDTGATHTDYDAYGRVGTATDGLGGKTGYSYERYHRVSEVKYTAPGGTSGTTVQSYGYDSAPGGKGQLAFATRYNDGGKAYRTSIAGYTADYQPTSMTLTLPDGTTSGTTADGFKTNYTYDYTYNDDGQLEKYTTPEVGGLTAETVINRYNEAGLPTTVSGRDWYVADTSYSPYGQVMRSTVGEVGHRVWQDNSFDESTGELSTSKLVRENATDTSITGNTVSRRSYAYDPSGNILSVADKTGTAAVDQQCFTYDTLGQLKTAWTTPSGGACTAAGKTTAEPVYSDGKVNVSSNNDGYWQSYDYDVLGNRKSKTVYKADPTFTAAGARVTTSDVSTVYNYGKSEDTAVKNDQPHTLTSYDATSHTAAGAEVKTRSTQTYDAAGNLINRSTGGDTSQGLTWTWDGQIETVTGFGPDGSGPWLGASDMCMDLAGGNPAAGTVIQIYACNASKAQNFRLKALDADNNGTVENAAVGQFVVAGACAQPTSAAAGAAVQVQPCNKDTATQLWEVQDTGLLKLKGTTLCMNAPSTANSTDLVLATCSASATGQVFKPASKTTYVYDGMGNRVLERSTAGAVLHLPDTTVSLTVSGKVRSAERTYGHGGAPTVTRFREASSTTGTSEHLFAQAVDNNGTPLAEVRLDGGQAVRVTKKDPWGDDRKAYNTSRSRTAYATGDADSSAGLVHLGAREYDPATGRFVSADPVLDQSDPLQANGYSYANNNPVTHSDPSGLTSSASSFDASIAALDAKIADFQHTLSTSIGDVILSVGWAVFKEFIGWNDVVGCFSQGDLWACGSLLMDAIPWTSIFSKGKKMFKAFKATMGAVKAWKAAKAAAEIGLKAAKAAKAMLIKAKKAAEAAAAEAKRKARDAAKAAAEAAKKKAHTGSKGARGNAPQVKARKSAQEKGSSGGGRAENKSGGKRGDSGRDDADSGGGSDGGSGGSCKAGNADPSNSFTPETRVLMADGSTKAIKDVRVGDQVMATDPETGQTQAETVTAEIKGKGLKHLVNVTIDTDGEKGSKTAEVTATEGHPFWVPELREWITASDLTAGQSLQTGAGTFVQITSIERWTGQNATVHNLTISSLHTYYVLAGATPVLVHNCGTVRNEIVEETQAVADSNVDIVAHKRKSSLVSQFSITMEDAMATGMDFLGEGATDVSRGRGVWKSADGRRGFRIDPQSLAGGHWPDIPHVHFELFDETGKKFLANNHVPLVDASG